MKGALMRASIWALRAISSGKDSTRAGRQSMVRSSSAPSGPRYSGGSWSCWSGGTILGSWAEVGIVPGGHTTSSPETLAAAYRPVVSSARASRPAAAEEEEEEGRGVRMQLTPWAKGAGDTPVGGRFAGRALMSCLPRRARRNHNRRSAQHPDSHAPAGAGQNGPP